MQLFAPVFFSVLGAGLALVIAAILSVIPYLLWKFGEAWVIGLLEAEGDES